MKSSLASHFSFWLFYAKTTMNSKTPINFLLFIPIYETFLILFAHVISQYFVTSEIAKLRGKDGYLGFVLIVCDQQSATGRKRPLPICRCSHLFSSSHFGLYSNFADRCNHSENVFFEFFMLLFSQLTFRSHLFFVLYTYLSNLCE